jgi:hypothetical protein
MCNFNLQKLLQKCETKEEKCHSEKHLSFSLLPQIKNLNTHRRGVATR